MCGDAMTGQRSSREKGAQQVSPAPPAVLGKRWDDLLPLGEGLKARAEDVLERTVATSSEWDEALDAGVRERFERISISSTLAAARWIAGEGIEAALEAGQETWGIFAELAAHRRA